MVWAAACTVPRCFARGAAHRLVAPKFIYGLWAEGVSDLWTIESYANNSKGNMAMIGDILKVLKASNLLPNLLVKELRYLLCHESRLTT